ncbi:MAG: hypothetical protein WBD50_04955 [Candidatus Rhabdochlamydia sp.]
MPILLYRALLFLLYVALPCFFLIRMWYNYTTSLGKWILQAPSSWFVHIRSVFNWSMAHLWVFRSISFGAFVYRIFLGLNGADYSNLIELALYGSSHTMDAFRYLSITHLTQEQFFHIIF